VRVALVGAGVIAARYAPRIAEVPGLELVGATDVVPGRAQALVAAHGGSAYPSLEALLADGRVETVVNLTVPQAHAAVTAAALRAGKHVHSEKPLALTHADAAALVELAAEQGVRLSAAPTTLLGEAQQTLWREVRAGRIGRVRVAYAEANWGRLESWHPDPRTLYAVGPLVDVGIYPLTILTAMFGPVRSARGYATTLEPERTLPDGTAFSPAAPDLVVAVLEHEDGVVTRLTSSFWVGPSRQRGIELHGDDGSLHVPTWAESDTLVSAKTRAGEYEPLPHVRGGAYAGIDWATGLLDLAHGLRDGRPHRSSGEHAAHVVEALAAVARSAETGAAVPVRSGFPPPLPQEWAL
jgi:predicted dehydrogenase